MIVCRLLTPGDRFRGRTGRRILGSDRRIDTDPFRFAVVGQPWVAYEWLGACVMAVLDRIGGRDTLPLATGGAEDFGCGTDGLKNGPQGSGCLL